MSVSPAFRVLGDGKVWSIGVIHGQFDQSSSVIDDVSEDAADQIIDEKINAGIAIVTPSDRIRETLLPFIGEDLKLGTSEAG